MSDLVQSDPALDEAVTRRDPLISYFLAGSKPRDQWRIGTEYEKVGVDRRTGRAAPYGGPRGIEELLRRMADRFGWTPRLEAGRIIALTGERATITLEPGAQLELSGEACDSIHCAYAELTEHVNQVVTVGEELGLAFLGLGIQPVSAVDEIEWVPKARYAIMGPYMLKVGTLGQRMMKQTATVQTNVDFADEPDAMAKLRVSMGLSPILTAMFANSSISEGRLNGYMSYRQHVWTDTDRDRCGLLPFVFSREAGFEDYADWALDAPMYFIRREGRFIDLTGLPFREYMRKGAAGHHATLADWQLHLTTLFPEVRLKTYIEIRSADSQPPERMLALPALVKGVLYDGDCLLGAWDLVKSWSWSERLDVYDASHREALQARIRGIKLLDLARELCSIAKAGLSRQNVRNANGEDETIYLSELDRQLESGKSSARFIAERWEREWEGRIDRLIDFAAYRIR
ncbi:MAG: glutamate--cysteine ligase [Candidatus Binatia bacterium]